MYCVYFIDNFAQDFDSKKQWDYQVKERGMRNK